MSTFIWLNVHIKLKTMNMYEELHHRADIHRHYLPRKDGGRHLKEISATVKIQWVWPQEYITSAKKKKKNTYRGSLKTHNNNRVQVKKKIRSQNTPANRPWNSYRQYKRQIRKVTATENTIYWEVIWGWRLKQALMTAAQRPGSKHKMPQDKVILRDEWSQV